MSGDPLYIENRSLDDQMAWLERCAAGPRETIEENNLAVHAARAIELHRYYRAELKEVIAAARPLASGGSA